MIPHPKNLSRAESVVSLKKVNALRSSSLKVASEANGGCVEGN